MIPFPLPLRHDARVILESLRFLADPEPRGAALNMALDEALLLCAARPVLRVYRWAGPAVSYGYFEPWEPVSVAHPGRDAVRRWTGGGVVPHGEDWTYSLIVPREEPLARLGAAESYRCIHARLGAALANALGEAAFRLTPEAMPKRSHACFENPARHDVLREGRKVAGAAQRRSRFGLLHQGSVQGVPVPCGFGERLATALARRVEEGALSEAEWEEARRLEKARYGSEAWNRRF